MSLPPSGSSIDDSLFILLMNEAFSYLQTNVKGISQLEEKLKDLGKLTGRKYHELFSLRERLSKRQAISAQNAYIDALSFLSGQLWRSLFGKSADSLEKNVESSSEFMIWEDQPVYAKFLSVPKDFGDFSTASFTAGIIESVLENLSFVSNFSHTSCVN